MIRTFDLPSVESPRSGTTCASPRVRAWIAGATIWAACVMSPPAFAVAVLDPLSVVKVLAAQDSAVLRVGERLAVAGTPFCGVSARSAGMTVQQLGQYGQDYRAAARALLGVATRPTVTLVASGGAAEAAGVRPGDVIAAIDGHVFADIAPEYSAATFAQVATAHDAIDQALADGKAELTIIRDERTQHLVIVPRPACRARFDVRAGRANNASSDGTYVQVSSDLAGQARGDGELAAILAHELAHNILSHPQRLQAKGPRPNVRTTEIEADRLSVYLLEAANYSPADAIAFWARWGRANDRGIFSDRSHPGWKKRIATIESEAEAIVALRRAGKPVQLPADLRPPR